MRRGLASAIERLSSPLGFRDFAQGRGSRGDPLARLEDQEHVSRSKGQDIWESRQPSRGKEGARIRLERKDIVAGKYCLNRLGTITITPDSWVWFSARSWATHQQFGERLHEPGTPNLWEAWVSLKFDGPTYGGTAAEDEVLCDRIIVVKQF